MNFRWHHNRLSGDTGGATVFTQLQHLRASGAPWKQQVTEKRNLQPNYANRPLRSPSLIFSQSTRANTSFFRTPRAVCILTQLPGRQGSLPDESVPLLQTSRCLVSVSPANSNTGSCLFLRKMALKQLCGQGTDVAGSEACNSFFLEP